MSATSITGAASSVTRMGIVVFGLVAAVWGSFVFPSMQREEPAERAASELLKGRAFQSRTLSNLLARSDSVTPGSICFPAELRDLVTLQIALVKSEAAEHKARAKADYLGLYRRTQAALMCSPSGAFMWVILFWLDASKDGLTPKNSEFLRMAYSFGPNEGWIAFWRIQVAFPLLDRMPEWLSQNVIGDFIKLLNTRILYNDLAAIVASEGPGIQTRLIEATKATDPVVRQNFARALHDQGVDVVIPGVQAPDRPWF